jgi:TetR/AcrR family tetracycline transcriptional repressor
VTSTRTHDEADKTRLSKAAVVQCALALADADGLEALTIRRLAQQLGVTPMALYWHFRSKEELLAGVAAQIWSEISTDVDPAARWSQQLRGLLESLIQVLRDHPSASQLLLMGEKNNDASLRAIEVTLDVLRRGGFDPTAASEIARSTLWTGLMLVMSEPGFDPALTGDERLEQQRRNRVRLAMLSPETYPRLVEAAGPMTACDVPEFHTQFGIDLFIAGVEAMAARQ